MSDVDNILKALDKAKSQIYRGIREGLVSEAEEIMDRSKREFVPIREGDLFNSAKVSVNETGQDIDKLEVVLSYGDEKTGAYALTVHETPSGYDPPTWEGKQVQFTTGGPKYLEKPLFEAENGMIDRIAEKIKLT